MIKHTILWKSLLVGGMICFSSCVWAAEQNLDESFSVEMKKEESRNELNNQASLKDGVSPNLSKTNNEAFGEQKIWITKEVQWPEGNGVAILTSDFEKQKKIKAILEKQFPNKQDMFNISAADCSKLRDFFAPYKGDMLPEERQEEILALWERANTIQDDQERLSLLKEVALLGNPSIQYYLVSTLKCEEGINFLHRSAAQGHPPALEELSDMYAEKNEGASSCLADILLKVSLKGNEGAQLKFARKHSGINFQSLRSDRDLNDDNYLKLLEIFALIGNESAESLRKSILHPGDIVYY